MNTFIILGLLTFSVIAIIFVVEKMLKYKKDTSAKMGPTHFLNSYFNDDATQSEFLNKSEEETVTLGQDILWAEAEKFGRHFSMSVVEPTQENFDNAYASALRIVKTVHVMHMVQNVGPLTDELPEIEVVLDTEDE